jgi:hypothetical protein
VPEKKLMQISGLDADFAQDIVRCKFFCTATWYLSVIMLIHFIDLTTAALRQVARSRQRA